MTSQSHDHSVTSYTSRDVNSIATTADKHSTTFHGVLGNGSHDDVVKTTSVPPLPTITTAFGDRAAMSPEVTSSSTGSGDQGTPHSDRSARYFNDNFAIVTVTGVCMISLALVLAIVAAILVRYVASFSHRGKVSTMVKAFYPQMPIGKLWIHRLLFVCNVVRFYGYVFLRRG